MATINRTTNPAASANPLPLQKAEGHAVEMIKQSPYDFGKLVSESSMEAKIQKDVKQKNAQGKDLLEQLNEDAAQGRAKKHKKELDKNDFMKLYITQLQAQDPTKPLENTELAQQMAQFNSLESLGDVVKGIEALKQSSDTSNLHNMVNYIGKTVEIEGGRLNFDGKQPMNGFFELDRDVTKGAVNIRDSSGQVIKKVPLSALNGGLNRFNWDGHGVDGKPVNPGVYHFDIEATDIDGKKAESKVNTTSEILGVKKQGDKPVFYTEMGQIFVEDVRAIKQKVDGSQLKLKDKLTEVDQSKMKPAGGQSEDKLHEIGKAAATPNSQEKLQKIMEKQVTQETNPDRPLASKTRAKEAAKRAYQPIVGQMSGAFGSIRGENLI